MDIKIIGESILREQAEDVKEFDKELHALIDDMIETMHDSDGIGLAAPQVGIGKRLLVVDISPIDKSFGPMAFINPDIVENEGEATLEEGCLSIPGIREEVTRPETITLQYQDENGQSRREEFSGWMSRVLQHEIDHLNGVLFIDYLSPVKQKLALNKLNLPA